MVERTGCLTKLEHLMWQFAHKVVPPNETASRRASWLRWLGHRSEREREREREREMWQKLRMYNPGRWGRGRERQWGDAEIHFSLLSPETPKNRLENGGQWGRTWGSAGVCCLSPCSFLTRKEHRASRPCTVEVQGNSASWWCEPGPQMLGGHKDGSWRKWDVAWGAGNATSRPYCRHLGRHWQGSHVWMPSGYILVATVATQRQPILTVSGGTWMLSEKLWRKVEPGFQVADLDSSPHSQPKAAPQSKPIFTCESHKDEANQKGVVCEQIKNWKWWEFL